MKSWLLIASLLIVNTLSFAMATSPFVGTWQLAELMDSESNPKDLPEGKKFTANIVEDGEFLRVAMKIGNNMRSKVTLVGEGTAESQTVTMSGVLSTMMMPPAEVFAVEKFISKTIPTVTELKLDGDKLTFVGEGSIVLTK